MKVGVLMTMPPKPGKTTQAALDTLHRCKAVFCDRDVLGIITALCHEPLSKFPECSEADRRTLQLYLTFVRNMAAIPDAQGYDKAIGQHHLTTLSVRSSPSCGRRLSTHLHGVSRLGQRMLQCRIAHGLLVHDDHCAFLRPCKTESALASIGIVSIQHPSWARHMQQIACGWVWDWCCSINA